MQHTAKQCNTLNHTATHCTTLQPTAAHCNLLSPPDRIIHCNTAPRCNTLHHTAPHCTTLHHNASQCTTMQPHYTALHHIATHCNLCNPLQLTETYTTHYNTPLPPESNTRASGLRHDVFNRIGPLKLDHQAISPGSSALRSRNAPNPRKGVSRARPSNGDPSTQHCAGISRLALRPRRSVFRLLQRVSSLQVGSFRAGNSGYSGGMSEPRVAPAAAVDHLNPRTDLAPIIIVVAASTARPSQHSVAIQATPTLFAFRRGKGSTGGGG